MDEYQAFLAQKLRRALPVGLDCDVKSDHLWQWQADLVTWAARKGRAALWTGTGTGKTRMQLVWAQAMSGHGRVLIVAPLAVGAQTVAEGAAIGIEATHSRDGTLADGITVTNYEQLAKFDLSKCVAVVLDESSILKNYSGKMRTELIERCAVVPYRLACTATPSPNDLMELGNHAEFLGVCKYREMLTEYFLHENNVSKAGGQERWRLKRHAVADFWRWVASWAISMQSPADLGYQCDEYVLPGLSEEVVCVPVALEPGPGELFAGEVTDLQSRRRARRHGIDERCAKVASLVAESSEPCVVWCDLNDESRLCAKLIDGAVEVTGSQPYDEKERILTAFAAGDISVLVTKPSIAGFGLNWQHCNRMVFAGVSDSYELYYQAVRRCWRFGQHRDVSVHVVTSDVEMPVIRNLKRKHGVAQEMTVGMIEAAKNELAESTHHVQRLAGNRVDKTDKWEMREGDACQLIRSVPDGSVDFTIFSPPFASLYIFSQMPEDCGNVRSHEEFFEHFAWVTRELYRVTAPGRLCAIHCTNLPKTINTHGNIGLFDFRGDVIRAMEGAGFLYHSEVCIWKDPVVSMQRTKRITLLYKQLRKDSSLSSMGIPDYLVILRKPGENAKPIAHTHEQFDLDFWQRYASPVWMDITQGKTLQHRSARDDEDEKHICPLQLQVIERAVDLWSAPGDLVLSPFAGIGSEGYVSVMKGRRFLGFELKASYYDQAVLNLKEASPDTAKQMTLGLFA